MCKKVPLEPRKTMTLDFQLLLVLFFFFFLQTTEQGSILHRGDHISLQNKQVLSDHNSSLIVHVLNSALTLITPDRRSISVWSGDLISYIISYITSPEMKDRTEPPTEHTIKAFSFAGPCAA